MSKKGIFFAAVLVFCMIPGSGRLFADVFAKENEAESLYGKGVHAFFDADYRGAIKTLTKVEELGSEDPRPYYFLALSYHRLGKSDEAEATFKTAAKLEWEGRSARDFDVSNALKRVQGKERLYVESFRRQAKLDWEKADQNRQEEKYGQEQIESKSILAKLAKGSELPPPEPSRFIGVAPFGARSIDPLPGAAEDAKLIPANDVAPAPLPKSAAKKTEDGEEPAGTATTKPKKDDDENPFGASTDEKKEEPAGMATTSQAKEEKKEEKKADDDDPFK